MTIISKRGRLDPAPKAPEAKTPESSGVIYIFDISSSSGVSPLTEEEQEEIRRMFENIRKQLDAIAFSDWRI